MALSQAFTVVSPGSVVAPTLNEIPSRVAGTNSHGKSGTGAAISLQDIFEILSIPDRCFWGEFLGVKCMLSAFIFLEILAALNVEGGQPKTSTNGVRGVSLHQCQAPPWQPVAWQRQPVCDARHATSVETSMPTWRATSNRCWD